MFDSLRLPFNRAGIERSAEGHLTKEMNDLLKPLFELILSEEADIVIVSEDGDIIETHKILLSMFSKSLAGLVDENSVQGISIPLKTEAIKNLINRETV